jgi:hypothetical protein
LEESSRQGRIETTPISKSGGAKLLEKFIIPRVSKGQFDPIFTDVFTPNSPLGMAGLPKKQSFKGT